MNDIDYASLEPSDTYLVHLGANVWLMDDHRWALLVWERERTSQRYTLVHADQHWDAVYDFYGRDEEADLLRADVSGIEAYLRENKLIRYDSFIAPALSRGVVDVVHFYCTENRGNEVGLYSEFLKSVDAVQFIHPTVESLAAADLRPPVIFDLCLDLFNRSDQWAEGDIWSETEICSFFEATRHIVGEAEMVTVSLSFNYSGTHEDTRSLAELALPMILGYRHAA